MVEAGPESIPTNLRDAFHFAVLNTPRHWSGEDPDPEVIGLDLVVVASMTAQWKDEMGSKFGLSFVIIDRERVVEIRRTRGFTYNPWRTGSRFIISHSLLADETYAAGLRDVLGGLTLGFHSIVMRMPSRKAVRHRARGGRFERLTAPFTEPRLFPN